MSTGTLALKLFEDHTWASGEVAKQLMQRKHPYDVKVSRQLTAVKPPHANWILDLYNHLKSKNELRGTGFVAAGITEAIEDAKSNEASRELI